MICKLTHYTLAQPHNSLSLINSQIQPVPVAKASPINPVPGGGALKVGEGGNGNHEGGSKDGLPTQRARATGMTTLITLRKCARGKMIGLVYCLSVICTRVAIS